MKLNYRIFASLLMLLLSISIYSQILSSVNYTMSFPAGETNQFIKEPSFRGITVDGRLFMNENISLGVMMGWSVFYENINSKTVEDGTLMVTGDQYRYINAFPILANSYYYSGSASGGVRFYGGLGIGPYRINQRTDMGIWSQSNNSWHFGMAPELGILIPVGLFSNINISVKWNYAFKSGDSMNYNWVGLNIGYAYNNDDNY